MLFRFKKRNRTKKSKPDNEMKKNFSYLNLKGKEENDKRKEQTKIELIFTFPFFYGHKGY